MLARCSSRCRRRFSTNALSKSLDRSSCNRARRPDLGSELKLKSPLCIDAVFSCSSLSYDVCFRMSRGSQKDAQCRSAFPFSMFSSSPAHHQAHRAPDSAQHLTYFLNKQRRVRVKSARALPATDNTANVVRHAAGCSVSVGSGTTRTA